MFALKSFKNNLETAPLAYWYDTLIYRFIDKSKYSFDVITSPYLALSFFTLWFIIFTPYLFL